jgi:hypothetical protein
VELAECTTARRAERARARIAITPPGFRADLRTEAERLMAMARAARREIRTACCAAR